MDKELAIIAILADYRINAVRSNGFIVAQTSSLPIGALKALCDLPIKSVNSRINLRDNAILAIYY